MWFRLETEFESWLDMCSSMQTQIEPLWVRALPLVPPSTNPMHSMCGIWIGGRGINEKRKRK